MRLIQVKLLLDGKLCAPPRYVVEGLGYPECSMFILSPTRQIGSVGLVVHCTSNDSSFVEDYPII